ncbi:hypothetical protein CASFOL_006636 [Castilleja foliolosa]|uniref:Uncharacterized protein n=1 Tax=Castilleja foliolosa TaxID=1961234 RepID=A0ABD3E6X9_9LAMI
MTWIKYRTVGIQSVFPRRAPPRRRRLRANRSHSG